MNSNDRNMYDASWEGWEAAPIDPKTLPPGVLPPGQDSNNPGGGSTYRRVDLILMRMPKDRFEQNVRRPAEQARERQAASLATMVSIATEDLRKSASDRAQENVPEALVFRDYVRDPTD